MTDLIAASFGLGLGLAALAWPTLDGSNTLDTLIEHLTGEVPRRMCSECGAYTCPGARKGSCIYTEVANG